MENEEVKSEVKEKDNNIKKKKGKWKLILLLYL